MLVERVAATIYRYQMFAPGHRVGVAVSGGQDSVCLLHVLGELAPRLGLVLTVLHLDHRLRGEESAADAEFVRALAAQLRLEAIVESVDVPALRAATRDNLEQAARRARLDFFHRQMAALRLDRVATGHTRSDQAETVLLRLLRGSGGAGLAAIRPVTSDGLVRPLIDVDRAEAEAWLRERSLAFRADSTNQQLEFRRNRIRHQLLPELERDYNPSLTAALARTAAGALEEEEYWSRQIDALAAGNLRREPDAVLLPAAWLAALHPAVARRVIRRAIEQVKGDLRGIGFADVDRVLALAHSPKGSGAAQARGVVARRSFGWIRLAGPAPGGQRTFCLPLTVPGRVRLPGSGGSLSRELIESSPSTQNVYNSEVSSLDWERVAGFGAPLLLRNWRLGDRYQPAGKTREWKLKDLFQSARIPSWERFAWPVITLGDAVIWVRSFGPAAALAATPATARLLRITETSDLSDCGVDGASA